MALTACGGGSGSGATQTANSVDGGSSTSTGSGAETGPLKKIVAVPGTTAAVVALFPDGRAFYSANGYNLDGSGSTIPAYAGTLKVADVVALAKGVEALMSDGSAYFSPDGQNLGGGGASVIAYVGPRAVASLTRVGTGVDAVFASTSSPLLSGSSNNEVVYSSDGLNLGGGGNTVSVYSGPLAVAQIVPVGPGDAVDTLFSDGSVFYSEDNRSLAGGGHTVSAANSSAIKSLVPVGGGVLAQFATGAVYLSPDGRNLSGGGSSVGVTPWDDSIADGPFAPRDSAHGAAFLGKLWLSGGFAISAHADSCFTTCSFFDLWSSKDGSGVTWNTAPSFATATSPDPRDEGPIDNDGVQDAPLPTDFYDSYSAIIVWNGQLTAIGATVWRSPDGVTWARQNLTDGTASPGPLLAPQHATENSHAIELGGVLFFLQLETGEIYSTAAPDATGWTDLGAIPGYSPRCGAAAFLMGGQIWVEGGGACDYSQVYNDMWSSPDGVHWTQQATPAAWFGRMWPCVAQADGIVWLAGGYAPTDWNLTDGVITRRWADNHADVWYSRNGTDWKQFKADVGSGLPDDGALEPRHAPTCYVVGGTAATRSLMVIAGTGGVDPNGNFARTLNSIRRLPLPDAAALP